jgi:hypothetical protein
LSGRQNVHLRNLTILVGAAATLAFVLGFSYGNLLGLEHTFEFEKWQTLAGAGVAVLAVVIALMNTARSLSHAKELEDHRRRRKQAAVRALLPLALAQVLDYANRSAQGLNKLIASCQNNVLPAMSASAQLVQSLPGETLKALAEFIEYSDTVDARLIEVSVALIQMHDARVRALVEANCDPSKTSIVSQEMIEARILNAATIYAGASAVFDYARRRRDYLPPDVTWDAVRHALGNMWLWEDQHPRLYALVARREKVLGSPFDEFKADI